MLLLRNWIALVLALAALAPASAALGATITPAELVSRIDAAKSDMASARTLAAKLAALTQLKGFIGFELDRTKGDQTESTRKMRFTLVGLQEYLGYIDESQFATGKCDSVKDDIVVSFSPGSDAPEYVPGEAQAALDVLAILCNRPELRSLKARSQR